MLVGIAKKSFQGQTLKVKVIEKPKLHFSGEGILIDDFPPKAILFNV